MSTDKIIETGLNSLPMLIGQYEHKLQDLNYKRKKIFKNLRGIQQQQRFFRQSKHKTSSNIQHQNQQGLSGSPRKLVKPDSDKHVGSNEHAKTQSNSSRIKKKTLQAIPQTNKQDFKKASEAQSSLIDRNRRMFGGIASHLMKAKTRIESQGEKIKQKIEMEEKLRKKQQSLNEARKQEKKRGLEGEHQSAEKERETNARQILKYQNLILQTKYTNYVNQLQPFLMTKTEPRLLWKPAQDSVLIQKLKTQTLTHLQEQQKKVNEAIGHFDQVFDLQKFITENELQYYQNKLQRYFEVKNNYLLTKNQPQLLWKPAKFNEELKQQQVQSRASLNQEKQRLKEQFAASFTKPQQHLHQEEPGQDHSDSEQHHSGRKE